MIGGLFVVYGVILIVLGIGASDAEIDKAAGWNLNLWVGVAMLLVGLLFLAWQFFLPLSDELGDDGPPEDDRTVPGAHAPTGPDAAALGGSQTTRRTPRKDLGRPGEWPGAGREQREHGAAEAAAHHARAGRAGALERGHRVLDRGDARGVVVAQARVRGVEQRARGGQVAAPSAATMASTRAFSDRTWRARRSSGAGRAAAASAPACDSELDAERVACRAALRPALVVAALRVGVLGAGLERDEPPVAEVERHGPQRQRGEVDPQRWPSRPQSEASWSSRPVSAPTQSFSTREQSRASSMRSGSSAPASAEQREAKRGLERRRGGEARALRHVARDREPRAGHVYAGGAPAPPPMPRTNARQPSARRARSAAERVRARRGRAPRPGSRRRRAARPRR